MAWNTALDSAGVTYYWNEAGVSQYEKPADYNPATAQAAGAYSQYANNGMGSTTGYGAQAAFDFSSVSMQFASQYSQGNTNYKDVQDQGCDKPADQATADFWRDNELKVYGGSPPPNLTFEAANLPGPMMQAIHTAKYEKPSVIQAQTWPAAMARRDVIGIAKTGSGKTLAYLVPAFVRIAAEASGLVLPTLSTLVLAPTRELAVQIEAECVRFGGRLGISSACVYGGAPREKQLEQLQAGVHAIIATPGRLNDFLNTGEVRLDEVNLP